MIALVAARPDAQVILLQDDSDVGCIGGGVPLRVRRVLGPKILARFPAVRPKHFMPKGIGVAGPVVVVRVQADLAPPANRRG